MNVETVLIIIALLLTIVSMIRPGWPLLQVAVLLICVALLARMKSILPLILVAFTSLALFGCASVVHKREVTMVSVVGTNTTTETESARFFFNKEAAQKLNVSTHQNLTNYSHNVTATGVQASGDVEMMKAFMDGLANVGEKIANGATSGAIQGAAKAAVPVL